MKLVSFANTCMFLLGFSGSLLAQTQNQSEITADQYRFFDRQPFYSQKSAARHGLRHIGVEVELLEDGFVVSNVLDGYPAQQAGLRRGDLILKVDGAAYHPVNSFNEISGSLPTPSDR